MIKDMSNHSVIDNVCNTNCMAKTSLAFQLQLLLNTATGQYWLHKAGASPEIDNLRHIIYLWKFNECIK